MLNLAALLLLAACDVSETATTITGAVVDGAGRPVQDAEVFLAEGPYVGPNRWRSMGYIPARPELIATTRTDQAGMFAFDLAPEVPESDWARTWLVVWVHRPGQTLASYLVGRDWPRHAAPIKLRLTAEQPLLLEVTSPDGKPLPDARVTPHRVNNARLPRELADKLGSTTDDSGRTTLRLLDPASIDLLRVECDAYGTQWVGLPLPEADGARRVALTPVGSVRSRLMADDPRAVSAVPIRLATGLERNEEAPGGGFAETVTDALGRFEVKALAAGTLATTAEVPAEIPFRCQHGPRQAVAEGVANEFTISLERAVLVEGVVRDCDSGEPLADTSIWLDVFALPRNMPRSDQEGRYRAYLLPGQASASPWRMPRDYYYPSYTLDAQPVREGAERVELPPLLLARGATLRGRVVDEKGRGVAGAEIHCQWRLASSGPASQHAWSDREGAFEVYAVEPHAQLSLWASSAQGATAEPVQAVADAGQEIELVISQASALALEGRVLDRERRPVADAVVRLVWRQPDDENRAAAFAHFGGSERLLTDGEGRFRTPASLPRGLEYRAEIAAPGRSPTVTEFIDPVAWKSTSFGDIVMAAEPALRTVAGRVVDQHGAPLGAVRIFQSGDGPRRTQALTDAAGHFELPGVYAGPAFLFVEGPNLPLQGLRIDNDGSPAELPVHVGDDRPVRRLETLPEPLTSAERRKTALRLIEPLLPALKQGELESEKVSVLGILATLDPNRIAEYARLPVFSQLGLVDSEYCYHAARTLIYEDLEEALAMGEAIEQPHYRGRLYLAACDSLPDEQRERKMELLSTALLHARAEPERAQAVELMGQIGERWLDLGETERGTALLREGQKLAEQLPAPSEAAERAHDLAAHLRAYFAGSLARIDGPAAIKLSSGFSSDFADRYRVVVARGLAAHDPAAAERVLDDLDYGTGRDARALRVLHRMAAVDPRRAIRLARKLSEQADRGYALGIVAHGLVARDAAQATALLEEAFGLLERASAGGAYAWEHPAVLAAALLPVAERIDPALVDGYLWRAVAMRSPRAARVATEPGAALTTGALAMFVSRYDRQAARVLAAPIADHIRVFASDEDYWVTRLAWTSLAVVDAKRAEALLDALPEPPPLALRASKNIARRTLADAFSPTADRWWHKPYQFVLQMYDPDARDDAR
ncbi:MAG TPA: hypothetical protein VJ783_09780 [Pirellulales bacterium]|nr:hypothetical protein [Pirellulales bacterium]